MLAPLSVPSLELLRIDTLRPLLPFDAGADAELQDLLRVAAHALQCPMAMFSLLDSGMQWPKASFGFSTGRSVMQVPLCGVTVRRQDVRVVSDATLDPVMARHPMVTGEPGLRFYAGTVLQLNGHRIGSLCVLDRVPRTLDGDGRTLLLEVAHAVEQWMRSRREQVLLAEREREFRELAEQMPGVLYRLPLDGQLVPQYVSAQLRRFGYTPEQWTRSPGLWITAIHPDDLERVLDEQEKGFAAGKPFEMRYRLQTATGQWVPVRDVVRILHSSDGSPPMAHGVILAVETPTVTPDLHHPVLQAMPDGVLVVDEGGRIVDSNPRAQALLAQTSAQLLGRPLDQLLTLEAQDEPGAADLRHWHYAHPDGSFRHLEASVGALQHGVRVHVLRDVSARHAQLGWLRQLSQAADQASEAIVITDLAANIEYVNQAAIASSGYSREELIGRNSRILQSGMTPDSRYRKLWGNLTAGKPWRGFLNNRRKDGSHYIEFAVISPVCGPDGQVTHYLAVKEDITEKRRMGEDLERYRHHLDELVAQRTEELDRARRSAEAANAAKSAFLATMSHEIRTPMNGVIGIADVLQRSELTTHQRDLVDTMRESAQALLTVIDDILDFSKIEAGRLVLEKAPMALLQVVEKAHDALQPVAAARGVQLHAFVDPVLPDTYVGDAARLRQIIINLVGNAIKFSAGRECVGQVSLRALPDPSGGGVVLQVRDNGVGMSAEVQDRIFNAFVQGELSTTRQYGGTGLGLVITQRLVGAMNGAIDVESQPGEGACFSVRLPLPVAADEPLVAAGSRFDLSGLRVRLLLDATTRFRDWCEYLMAAGARVDWSLPDTAGPAGAETVLVCEPQTLSALPNEALTGVHAVLIRHELRAAPREVYPGLVELDCEGVHRDDLLQAVAMAAGRAGRDRTTTPVPPPPQPARAGGPGTDAGQRLILVAEDNEINQKVIRQQLELLVLDSEHVADGRAALERWQATPQRYALLLTDLHMPEMDGFELTRAVREAEASHGLPRLPVIALTANVAGADADKCRQAGMDAFLSKPVQLEQLRETLQHWLRAPVAAPAPLAGPAPLAADRIRSLSQPDFDDAVLQRLVGMDVEVMADLRLRYLQSLHVAVGEIANQVQRKDWAAAGLTAHRLKTSSRALGALRLGRIFEDLETAGRLADSETVLQLASDLVGAAEAAAQHYHQVPVAHVSPRVLCVDDDESQRSWLERQLRARGVSRPEIVGDGPTLLQRLEGQSTDATLLLMDLNMPQMDGVDLIHRLVKMRFAGTLLLLGSSDQRVIDAAERLARAHGLRTLGRLVKPLQEDSLRAALDRWPLMAAFRRG